MTFDADEDWYRRSGHTDPDQLDFQSVAAHEFGHAAGFVGHYNESDNGVCPESKQRHTMCPGSEIKDYGSERLRSPEKHDIEVFNAVYEPR